ncbi:MAG: peptide/nickel transport system permease protein [Actinomycetota bacterium]|nr:peptide/nickel transport system permease protein [Actinomycetota bacterium]
MTKVQTDPDPETALLASAGGEAGVLATSGGGGRYGVAKWVARRLALSVVVLFLVSIVVFVATQALPSDPAEAILGRDATPQRVAALTEQLNLDKPMLEQYTSWLGGVLTGDLGDSLAAQRPVADEIGSAFVNSIALLICCAIVLLPLAIGFGAWSAMRRDSFGDRGGLGAALLVGAIPDFVIGIVMTILLATNVFKVLPAVALFPDGSSPFSHPDALVLPTLTLVIASMPYLYRLSRASMIEILESDYVQMARLKGVSSKRIMVRHALPNALVPTIQASALVLSLLLSGVVVIEFLFRFPGLGSELAESVSNRDLPMIQTITLIYAAVIVLLNLIADLLTVMVSPRLRGELK